MGWWKSYLAALNRALAPHPSFRDNLAMERYKRGLSTLPPAQLFNDRRLAMMLPFNGITFATVDDAQNGLREIDFAVQELRLLQQEIRVHLRGMQMDGRNKRQRERLNPAVGIFGGVQSAKSVRARGREAMLTQQYQQMQPYEQQITLIDNDVLHLERLRLDIRRWIDVHQRKS